MACHYTCYPCLDCVCSQSAYRETTSFCSGYIAYIAVAVMVMLPDAYHLDVYDKDGRRQQGGWGRSLQGGSRLCCVCVAWFGTPPSALVNPQRLQYPLILQNPLIKGYTLDCNRSPNKT